MKTYMPLNGLRWSRNSGSANCDMPQSVVFGRPGGGKISELRRFEALPFKNKVIFTDKEYPEFRSAFCLKGIAKSKGGNKQVYQTANYVTAKRYIDQFDYVDFINQLRD